MATVIRRVDPVIAIALVVVATAAWIALATHRTRTIAVPADAPTIQDAIDRARDGDVIRVAPGDYPPVDFRGKAVAVLADIAHAPAVIRATDRVAVRFSSGESWHARLVGFDVAGAIACDGASPTIERNRITPSTASTGAGVEIRGASARPTLLGNRITGWPAAGVAIVDASPTLRGNRIANNGGGVSVRGGEASLEQNEIVENRGTFGGLLVVGATVSSTNDVVGDNETSGSGGGARVEGGTLKIVHATIARNRAATRGGGLAATGNDASIAITRTIVAGNRAPAAPQTDRVAAHDSLVQDDDPGFVAIDEGDFRLRSTSAARDALVRDADVDHDRDNDRRDMRPDIGADEFVPRLYVAEHAGTNKLRLVSRPGADVFLFHDLDPKGLARWAQGTYMYVGFGHNARFAMPPSGVFSLPLDVDESDGTGRAGFQAVVDGITRNAVLLSFAPATPLRWTVPGAPGARLVGLAPGTGPHRPARPSRAPGRRAPDTAADRTTR